MTQDKTDFLDISPGISAPQNAGLPSVPTEDQALGAVNYTEDLSPRSNAPLTPHVHQTHVAQSIPKDNAEIPEALTIEIFNLNNPNSIASALTGQLREKLFAVDRKLLSMPEEELRLILKPSATMNRVRFKFWKAYELFLARKIPITPAALHLDICNYAHFLDTICTPRRFAWIITPPIIYETFLEEAFDEAMSKMRDLLKVPLVKNGKIDKVAADLFFKCYDRIESRLHGSVTQRLEMKKLIVQKTLSPPPINPVTIDAEIMEIEKQLIENKQFLTGDECGPEGWDIIAQTTAGFGNEVGQGIDRPFAEERTGIRDGKF